MPIVQLGQSVINGPQLAVTVLQRVVHLSQSVRVSFNQMMLEYTHVQLLTVVVTLEAIAQKLLLLVSIIILICYLELLTIVIMTTGIGMYVEHSRYITGKAVKNNSLIVDQSCGRFCKIDVQCHSNSTSQSVGYYLFPNGNTVYSDSDHYDYYIDRYGYGGVRIRDSYGRSPDIWGIFICKIPDSNGNILEASIGIYSSMPSV